MVEAAIRTERDWSELLDKMGKILALEERAGTVEEAAAAAAAMTRLLVRYNLTRDDVTKRLDGRSGAKFETGAFDLPNAKWRHRLWVAASRSLFCRAIYSSQEKRIYVVGDPENVRAVARLVDRVSVEIDRLAADSWRASGDWNRVVFSAREWMGSYRMGAAVGVAEAIVAARSAATEDVPNGSALVLVKEEAVNQEFKRLFPRTKETDLSRRVYTEAYDQGKRDGRNIRVDDQLRS